MFTEQSLRQYPEVVKAFTGIPAETFWEMMSAIDGQVESDERERQQEQSLVVRVALVLTYLRLHVPPAEVGLLYGCHQSDVSRELGRILPLISRVWPGPEIWQWSQSK